MMKVAPAYPLPKLHVLTLLSDTCLPLTATTTNFFINYKFKRHATRPIIAQAHTHRESPKMEENGAIEQQSKFRSEFLQILRNRRPPQGTTISNHSFIFF